MSADVCKRNLNDTNELAAEHPDVRKSHKKKHKDKHHKHHKPHKHHRNQDERPQQPIPPQQHLMPQQQHNVPTPNQDKTLELRVPKLIVRKVVVKEGDAQKETMEVYSPDKSKKLVEIEQSFITGQNLHSASTGKSVKKARSRRSSRASSVASLEGLNHNKKRKKKTRLESSSEDEEAEEKIPKRGEIQECYLFYKLITCIHMTLFIILIIMLPCRF